MLVFTRGSLFVVAKKKLKKKKRPDEVGRGGGVGGGGGALFRLKKAMCLLYVNTSAFKVETLKRGVEILVFGVRNLWSLRSFIYIYIYIYTIYIYI